MDISSKTQICIFDVNGVLIESNLANAQAMGKAFTDDPALQNQIVKLYLKLTGIDRGSKIRIIQEKVMKKPFGGKEFERRWERVKGLVHVSMTKAPLIKGCREVLTELGKRKITRVALSNTPRAELQKILSAQNLESFLDFIRGGGDWPKSESLGRLLREFQFEPDKCLFIGDGKGDLTAARSAGVAFVAIDPGTGEFHGEEGFDGPYKNLFDWGQRALGMRIRSKRGG
ncbi:MAG: HAD hydrolase-like protein [Desulfobacteraceae bacterium]|jgi:phosphoglycolate phosphatase-like HAD superfamily hydrolase